VRRICTARFRPAGAGGIWLAPVTAGIICAHQLQGWLAAGTIPRLVRNSGWVGDGDFVIGGGEWDFSG